MAARTPTPPATLTPEPVTPDPWTALRRATPARLALGRAGASLPTASLLAFGLDHARARDAVHLALDVDAVSGAVQALGYETLAVESAAGSREVYLRRPDLGRRLSDRSRAVLNALAATHAAPADVAIVVADGLSAAAVHTHAAPLLTALGPHLAQGGMRLAPVLIARQARVALGDEVGALLGARLVAVLIGERPGLSSPDSLGAYLTAHPRIGRTDAERNCVSNIRREGLSPTEAARKIAWLIERALALGATGVALKDESDGAHLPSPDRPLLPRA